MVVASPLVHGLAPEATLFRPSGAAARRMFSPTAAGGTIGAYVWDYAGKMELMRHFWDAAAELDPAAAPLDEGVRFPLCRPEPLAALFATAGLRGTARTWAGRTCSAGTCWRSPASPVRTWSCRTGYGHASSRHGPGRDGSRRPTDPGPQHRHRAGRR